MGLVVGLRAWACRIQGLRTRNLQQGLGSSVNCLAVAPPLAVVSPFAGEPPLGNQATPEDPPTFALPHSPPLRVELGGNDRKELFPRLPLSASRTHFIFHTFDLFLSTWEGGKKARHLGSRSMFVHSL